MKVLLAVVVALVATVPSQAEDLPGANRTATSAGAVDASSLRGKVLCGYQGWFRCPRDRANAGWGHWSRDPRRIAPETLSFEMWPDLREYKPTERFPAPGFTHKDGEPAELFSSDNADTVRRHFEWMKDDGIDGVWLQHFVVELPGGPEQKHYESRSRVLGHVRAAAQETGRTWALTFDLTGMPTEKIFAVLTTEWKKLVDAGVMADERYLHEGGKPVVQVWGFYSHSPRNAMTAEVANQLIDFFKAPGRYHAYLVGGGDWNWRLNPDPRWQALFRRLDAYSPWNVGNTSTDDTGTIHAATASWVEDKQECEKLGMLWLPVIYPGFSWDNLQKKPPGSTLVPRRAGKFLWEQFHALSQLGADSVCVAMFDEVDEGTAIFKVTNDPPGQGHFVTYEGMPSDWYLRLVGEGTRMLHDRRAVPSEIPLNP